MAYATAQTLAERWPLELSGRAEAELEAALEAAAAEIDSYRPPGTLGAEATAILGAHSLTLARLALHPDIGLDDTHPIVREAKQVRAWLTLLARGVVHLPSAGAPGDGSGSTGAAWDSTPTVWGRDSDGGLA